MKTGKSEADGAGSNTKRTESDKARGDSALNHKKQIALVLLLSMLLVSLGYGGWMIKHRMDYAVTDAVFVDTDRIVNIGFERVEGRVVEMAKVEGDPVKKGEALARIDSKNYKLAAKQIREKLLSLKKQREKQVITLAKIKKQVLLKEGLAKDRVVQTKKIIDSLKAKIESLNATISLLQRDEKRYRYLYKEGAAAKRTFEEVETKLVARRRERDATARQIEAMKAQLDAAKKEVRMAKTNRMTVKELRKGIEALDASIESLETKLKDTRLNIRYCTLRSSIDGKVAKKYVSVGDVVGTGNPVYALINPKDIFVLVLLEEKKLKGVVPGCPANIKVDAYPDLKYRGKVEAILPASAAKFALVPRDISAGEFTKVAQRIPVKVKITKGDVSKLIVGMGGEIEIRRKKK